MHLSLELLVRFEYAILTVKTQAFGNSCPKYVRSSPKYQGVENIRLHSCTLAAQHRYMWHASGDTDVWINETGVWQEIPGLALKIALPEPASIRVLYWMSVMPDHNFGATGRTAGARPRWFS